MARVELIIDEKLGQTYQFENRITVGRDCCNIIQIDDQKVSRRHFSILKVKDFFVIKDLGSQNGTFVNQVRICESELKSGDRITFGDSILLFIDEPFDEIRRTDPGKIEGLKAHVDESIMLQIRFKSFKDALPRLNRAEQKLALIDSLSQLVTFSGGFRPIESGSLLFQDILEALHKLFVIERCYILLNKKADGEPEITAFRESQSSQQSPDFTRPIYKKVLIDGLSILFENASGNNFSDKKQEKRPENYTAMGAPIRSGMNTLGMLYVDTAAQEKFSEDDLLLLSAMGLIVGTNVCAWNSYKRLQAKSLSSLMSLATIADLNTPTPNGKITRIVFRAIALSETMGLSDDQIDTISTAAVFAALLQTFDYNSAPNQKASSKEPANKSFSRENALFRQLEQLPAMSHILRLLRYRNANYDGTGFPPGLSACAIPLGSRILRALLVFESMKDDGANIRQELTRLSGSTLDPLVVKALIRFTYTISDFGQRPTLLQMAQDETDS